MSPYFHNGKAPPHPHTNQQHPQFLYALWRRANARNVSFPNRSRYFYQYEISPRVLKNISRVRCVSPSGHVIFYLLYEHQRNTKSFHKRHPKARFWYVTIARVKISCFRAKAQLVFYPQKPTFDLIYFHCSFQFTVSPISAPALERLDT